MTEDSGALLVRLLGDQLQREEDELREVAENSTRPHSIQEYFEQWLQFLVFKTSLHQRDCPQVLIESHKIDLCFQRGGGTIAGFEFTRPFTVNKGDSYLKKIVKDFEKQWFAAKQSPDTAQYVVLTPMHKGIEIEDWLNGTLMPEVKKLLPEARFERPTNSAPIRLNNGKGDLSVIAIRVLPAKLHN